LWDLDERLNKLFKLYDSNIELSGILVFTSIVVFLLIIVLLDNREVIVNDKIYYEQFVQKNYRDGILGFTIVYLFALYLYSKKKTNPNPQATERLCPTCKTEVHSKCTKCGKNFDEYRNT
jgi:hypothetical protein